MKTLSVSQQYAVDGVKLTALGTDVAVLNSIRNVYISETRL